MLHGFAAAAFLAASLIGHPGPLPTPGHPTRTVPTAHHGRLHVHQAPAPTFGHGTHHGPVAR